MSMERDQLSVLPPELLTIIMQNLSSVRDLSNLAHTSKIFLRLLRRNEQAIVTTVLTDHFEYRYFLLTRLAVDIGKSSGKELDYICGPNGHQATGLRAMYEAEVRAPRSFASASLDTKLQMATFHELTARFSLGFLEAATKQVLGQDEDHDGTLPQLSCSESIRLQRALIHHELMCRSFLATVNPETRRTNLRNFLRGLPQWQRDEIHSIERYLTWCWAEILPDFVNPHAVNRLVERRAGPSDADRYKQRYRCSLGETERRDTSYPEFVRGLELKINFLEDLFSLREFHVVAGFVAGGVGTFYEFLDMGPWARQLDFVVDWWTDNAAAVKRRPHLDTIIVSVMYPNPFTHEASESHNKAANTSWIEDRSSKKPVDFSDDPDIPNAGWQWRMSREDGRAPMLLVHSERFTSVGLWFWNTERSNRWGVFDGRDKSWQYGGFDLSHNMLRSMLENNLYRDMDWWWKGCQQFGFQQADFLKPGHSSYRRFAPSGMLGKAGHADGAFA